LWLTRLRSVFLSGTISKPKYGEVLCELHEEGQDEILGEEADYEWSVYQWMGEYPWAAPVHECCLELLARYIGIQRADLDIDVLFHVLKTMAHQYNHLEQDDYEVRQSLNIEYGDAASSMKKYLDREREKEYLFANPVTNKQLERLSSLLGNIPPPQEKQLRVVSPSEDPLARLGGDILKMIATDIDLPDLLAAQTASPAFANLYLPESWWRLRFKKTMPFIWELPNDAHSINWEQATFTAWELSTKTSFNAWPELVNRRRIWEQMLPIFSTPYQEGVAARKRLGYASPPVLNGIYGTSDRLGLEKVKGVYDARIETLINSFEDLSDAEPALLAHWTEDGYLAGLQIVKADQKNVAHDLDVKVAKTERANIGRDDWLTGFVVQTRVVRRAEPRISHIIGLEVLMAHGPSVQLGLAEGEKRYIDVMRSGFIVGLHIRRRPRGTVRTLGLYEQPAGRARGNPRVEGERFRDLYDPMQF
jgi:hypothetical protein